MKKLNNKGFTLVELLAVLVILIAIMSIAIPSISSSLERSKSKQDTAKQKILVSAAELYVTDHKNNIINNMGSNNCCKIIIEDLKKSGYVDEEATKDSNNNYLGEHITYNKNDSTFKLGEDCDNTCDIYE